MTHVVTMAFPDVTVINAGLTIVVGDSVVGWSTEVVNTVL
jgi:hypothetical protein